MCAVNPTGRGIDENRTRIHLNVRCAKPSGKLSRRAFFVQEVVPIVTVSLAISLLASLSQAPIRELDYQLTAVPAADRTLIQIRLKFKATPGQTLAVDLPQDYYGSPPLHQFVTSFDGADGTVVATGKGPQNRQATATKDGLVSLRYTLSFDPAKLENATFSPNVSPLHFHLAGCQWMLRIGDTSEKRRHRIAYVDAPKGWRFYSSIAGTASKMDTTRSYSDLISSAFGGTGRGFYETSVRGKEITISIPHSLAIPDEKVVDAVRRIIDIQRTWFKDDSDEFFHVAINPKEGNIAGTCVRRHFVCYLKHDITPDQLNLLLAHEMFHNWVGNQIVIEVPAGQFELKHQWFSEGVNEYFARKLLLEAGLMTHDAYAELFNRDLANLRDNPNRNLDLAALSKAADEGRFNTPFTKLAYYRGPLIALRWDRDLRAAGKKDTSALLRDLFVLSKSEIKEEVFFAKAASLGIPLKSDFEKFVLRGETILVESDMLGPDFELKTEMAPLFDTGFDLDGSRSAGMVKGVRPDSKAYAAGLRDGMKLISAANTNRFANAWDPAKPLKVTVAEDGKERVIEYFPHGKAEPLAQFVRKRG